MLYSRKSSQKCQTEKVTHIIYTLLLLHIHTHTHTHTDTQTHTHSYNHTFSYLKTIEFMNDVFNKMSSKKYGKNTMVTTKY